MASRTNICIAGQYGNWARYGNWAATLLYAIVMVGVPDVSPCPPHQHVRYHAGDRRDIVLTGSWRGRVCLADDPGGCSLYCISNKRNTDSVDPVAWPVVY